VKNSAIPEKRVAELETDLRHLQNELRLTREENEESSRKYFDLYLRLNELVRERTSELEEANKRLTEEVEFRKQAEAEKSQLIDKLQRAISEVKTLSGLLPICSSCKKIRDDKGYWNQLEVYIRDHSEADFTHSICPECIKRLYPELFP